MSVKTNAVATVASRVYLAAISLVMLPFYIREMGLEVYGLVALFLSLQVWFQLLDVGLTPTMARESARHRAGALSAHAFRVLLRSMEGVFLGLAALAGLALFGGADFIAAHWLKVDRLTHHDVVSSLRMMAICIALKLMGELYRGTLSGFERLVWLAGFNSFFGTMRWVLVVPYMAWVGSSPVHFFGFQLAVAIFETLVLGAHAYRLLPRASTGRTPWRAGPLREVLGFSVVMSLASVVWITLSQLDKLLLAGLLSLADFGAFSLAAAAAGGVLLVSSSLTEVLLPRLTRLHTEGLPSARTALYRRATQLASGASWSVASVLAVHAHHALWVWTGDATLAAQAAPMLTLYALGNATLAVGALPYYLQFAEGRLRLHLVGTSLMVVVMLPCLVWATSRFGGVGAAGVWLGVNMLYLLLWTPVAHSRFLPGLHWRWLFEDVLPVAGLAAATALACAWLPWPAGRAGAGVVLVGVSLLVLLASACGSSWCRAAVQRPAQLLA